MSWLAFESLQVMQRYPSLFYDGPEKLNEIQAVNFKLMLYNGLYTCQYISADLSAVLHVVNIPF